MERMTENEIETNGEWGAGNRKDKLGSPGRC